MTTRDATAGALPDARRSTTGEYIVAPGAGGASVQTILIVDDTPANLHALQAVLQGDGVDLVCASSGRAALEILLERDVAVAIFDVQMPEMDGLELATLVRGVERNRRLPIIFVTAGARDEQHVFAGYEAGAVDFLFKPVDPVVLRRKVNAFLELDRQRQELADALRLNELFLAVLGHDLRSPLGVILLGTQGLEQQLTDDRQIRTLQRMTRAGERMANMIEQMLDLTRARLAKGLGFVGVRKRLDVVSLVRRTVEELLGSHPGKDVTIETRGLTTTHGDPDRLLQLFSNLISNALSHGDDGAPPSVVIEGGGGEIVIAISNRGVIPAELLASIFDPFRSRIRTSASSSGLGLGLFIAQQVALAHGGSISVRSGELHGTTFTVRLPLKLVGQTTANSADRKIVLIIEDDEHVRESLRDAFEEEGCHAVTASDGHQALELLRVQMLRPDLVVLDLIMPVVDGAEVYATMQADPALARIPVIVSTSHTARAPAGAIVMAKPVKLDRLLDRVAEIWRDSTDMGS